MEFISIVSKRQNFTLNVGNLEFKDLSVQVKRNTIIIIFSCNKFLSLQDVFFSYAHIALKLVRQTLSDAVTFFFLFFFPNIGKHFGQSILGDSAEYFRKVFWNSMDNRTTTKMKRGDLIDTLMLLKSENAPNELFRK